MSGDPDSEAASWPRRATPVGIANEIPEGGVFPKVDDETTWQEGDKLDSLAELEGALNNHKLYEEEREAADALFQKEVDKGFVHWAKDKTDLEYLRVKIWLAGAFSHWLHRQDPAGRNS